MLDGCSNGGSPMLLRPNDASHALLISAADDYSWGPLVCLNSLRVACRFKKKRFPVPLVGGKGSCEACCNQLRRSISPLAALSVGLESHQLEANWQSFSPTPLSLASSALSSIGARLQSRHQSAAAFGKCNAISDA